MLPLRSVARANAPSAASLFDIGVREVDRADHEAATSDAAPRAGAGAVSKGQS